MYQRVNVEGLEAYEGMMSLSENDDHILEHGKSAACLKRLIAGNMVGRVAEAYSIVNPREI